MNNLKLTKKTLSLVSALSLMITSASFPSVSADDKTEEVSIPNATETYTVSSEDSIQQALNNASDNTDSEYTEVVLKAGETYYIDLPLKVYSNTIIQAEGAVIERTYNNPAFLSPEMIRNVSKDGTAGKDNKLGKYDVTKNVYLNGGIWSGGSLPDTVSSSTNIIFCHAENIYLLNADFQNNYNGHLVEINAVNNCLIQNCSFNGLKKSNSSDSYVALQIDIAHSYDTCNRSDGEHAECPTHDSIPVGYYPDDTACKNIRVLSNYFNTKKTEFGNFDSACGSNKTLTDGAGPVNNAGSPVYHENINISYNTINDCSYAAITSRGHKNITIKGNTINNCGDKGIIVKRCLGGTVTDNVLTDIGDMGILLFEKSTLPANDPNRNVTQLDSISNNTITRAGYHGIAIQDESSISKIDGNSITDVQGHGISASGNSKITESIEKNTINNSKMNGVHIYDGTTVNAVTGNNISGAKNNGIIINKSSSVTGKISDNTVKDSTMYGLRVADGSNTGSIEKNNISGSGEDGINMWNNASAASISQNTVSGSKQNGIALSTNCKTTGNIDGNTISSSGKNGIFIYSGSSAASISGNKVSYSASHGIAVSTNSSVTNIISNNVSYSTGNGITVSTKSKVNKILKNTFSNNGTNCKVSKDSSVAQNDNASATAKKPKTTKVTAPKVKKAKILNVKSKKKKTATVTFKKLKNVDGYYLEYSLKKTFKGLKTKKLKKSIKKCTIKNLKSNKKYFIRLRAYKKYTVNGVSKIAYGAYSAVKKVKVK